jgi:hypothetical protein
MAPCIQSSKEEQVMEVNKTNIEQVTPESFADCGHMVAVMIGLDDTVQSAQQRVIEFFRANAKRVYVKKRGQTMLHVSASQVTEYRKAAIADLMATDDKRTGETVAKRKARISGRVNQYLNRTREKLASKVPEHDIDVWKDARGGARKKTAKADSATPDNPDNPDNPDSATPDSATRKPRTPGDKLPSVPNAIDSLLAGIAAREASDTERANVHAMLVTVAAFLGVDIDG